MSHIFSDNRMKVILFFTAGILILSKCWHAIRKKRKKFQSNNL